MATKRPRQRKRSGKTGAIYARFSTKFQDSIESQIASCLAWAKDSGIVVPEDLIFTDEATTGKRNRREGLTRFTDALRSHKADVAILLTTSRLFRNQLRALRFMSEEILSAGKRCVFVGQNIDSDDNRGWQLHFKIQTMLDELQASSQTPNIQSAQLRLFNEGLVYGTLGFGYRGEELPGRFNTKGKPVRRIVIDEGTAKWVRSIYKWYADDGLTVPEIARKLNMASAPLPPRCATGHWTDLAVRTALTNTRYRGFWVYGETENVWQEDADYARQYLRSEPLGTRQAEDLRIVDDAMWYAAEDRIANDPHRPTGRRSDKPSDEQQPRILNGILRCGHCDDHRLLTTGGSRATKYICPQCKRTNRALYSHLCRARAHQVVFSKIREIITADTDLARRVIGHCQNEAERMQNPDPKAIDESQRKLKKLQKHEQFLLRNPGDDDSEIAESNRALKEVRAEAAKARALLAAMLDRTSQELRVPTVAEVRKQLDLIIETLANALGSPEDTAAARQIVKVITGGRIDVFQRGERVPGKGWIIGRFSVNVVALVASEFGASMKDEAAPVVEVSFREPAIHEQISNRVKELYDKGKRFSEIATIVGRNRNLARKAFDHWFTSHGLTPPEPRRQRSRLVGNRRCEQIADAVMELVAEDMPLGDIAKRFGCSRNLVTRALRIGHERRGLPVPDGRTLRKARNARIRNGG